MTNENHEPDAIAGLVPESTEPEMNEAAKAEFEAEVETAAEEELKAEEAENEAETEIEAEDGPEPESEEESGEDEPERKPRPPAKLERLQKILAKAGVASRRHAEEMIEQGRIQVNGKVITELGTKADAARDHIRVDGKLLQGAERLRYFVLNKPRGFVTTVKDPEHRPTVMQFFDKMAERLYPVGRLDYLSEGLLVVTNDGDLANRLTRAASGVEKTYLVKVAGQPTEAELEVLRGGVSIERGKPGSGRVRTSPARVRQVRQGDNPWYEVVLIEGRNRELRKMFEEIGHFVEKIRRIGYGPLVLDQEPGNLRELEPAELAALRLVAEGKLRTPKSKEIRRRDRADAAQLPTVAPKPSRPRPAQPFVERPVEGDAPAASAAARPRKPFGHGGGQSDFKGKPYRPAAARSDDRPRRSGANAANFGPARPDARAAARPAWKKDDRPTRPPAGFAPGTSGEDRPAPGRSFPDRPAGGRSYGSKPPAGKSFGDKPAAGRTFGARPPAGKSYGSKPGMGRPGGDQPAWKKPEKQEWPAYKRPPAGRPAPSRREAEEMEDLAPRKPSKLHIEPVERDERPSRPTPPRPSVDRPSRSSEGRSGAGRTGADRPHTGRSSSSRPPAGHSGPAKPFRGEGGLSRPFTTSSGKPRAGGARPSSKPGKAGKPSARPYGAGSRTGSDARPSYGAKRSYESKPGGRSSSASRPSAGPAKPYTPRTEPGADHRPTKDRPYPPSATRAERKAGPGWKPKPSFGGPGKPSSGSRSKTKAGGFSKSGRPAKSGFKGKSSGPKRTGGKPGGKKRSK